MSVPDAPFVEFVNVYVPGVLNRRDCVAPLHMTPRLPEAPVPTASAAPGFANVTLKQVVLFGVEVAVNPGFAGVFGTVHVTTAPVFPSTTASVTETVKMPGKKMKSVPEIAC